MKESIEKISKKIDAKQSVNFAFVFILYIIFANLFQIIGLYSEYPALDNIWKASVLILLLGFAIFKTKRLPITKSYYWPFLVALLLYQFLNVLITGDLPSSIGELTFILFPPICFFIFLILFNTYRMTHAQLLLFFKLFVFFIIYACIINFIINYETIISISNEVRAYELSLSSFFDNRNTFGFYLFLGVLCNFYILLKERKNKLFYLTFATMLISLLLSLSRSSIVAVLVFLTVFLILENKAKLYIKYLTTAALVMFVILLTPGMSDFINNNVIRADAGLTGRDNIYSQAIDNIDDSNFLFGTGYSSSRAQLSAETGFTSTHNVYLSVLTAGGVILFCFFIAVITYATKRMLQIRHFNLQLGNFLLALLVSYLIYSLTESKVPFFSSVTSFTITTLIVFIPLYLSNHYTGKQGRINSS